jgi:hypothetical protein
MNDERRRTRSDHPLEAASLYLQTAAERGRVQAVVVANEDGFVLASVGRGYDLQSLAALGLAYGGDGIGHDFPAATVEDITRGDDLYTSALDVCGERLYVASVGNRLPRQREAAEAFSRILGPALAG